MGRAGVISAIAIAGLALAGPAVASERIAYSSGAPSQVFTLDPGGGSPLQITHEPAGAAHPDWSPDGRSVAYDVGGERIAVASASGAGQRYVTVDMSAIDPSWSPDSSQLAFTGVEYDESGSPEDTSLYVTQADGSNYVRIGPGSEPDWSPRADWIVYRSNPARSGGCAGIWRMRSDGSGNTDVAQGVLDGDSCRGGGSDPSFSPNGRRIAFVSGDGRAIYTTDLRGRHRHRVVRDSRLKSSPVYSPDGRRIVFSTSDGLWVVPARRHHHHAKKRRRRQHPKPRQRKHRHQHGRRIARSSGYLSWQPR